MHRCALCFACKVDWSCISRIPHGNTTLALTLVASCSLHVHLHQCGGQGAAEQALLYQNHRSPTMLCCAVHCRLISLCPHPGRQWTAIALGMSCCGSRSPTSSCRPCKPSKSWPLLMLTCPWHGLTAGFKAYPCPERYPPMLLHLPGTLWPQLIITIISSYPAETQPHNNALTIGSNQRLGVP